MASLGTDTDAGPVYDRASRSERSAVGPGGLRPCNIVQGAAQEPVTLAESLMADAGWSASNFSEAGPNPPYLRIGGKLWVTLTEYEPCFSSYHRDRMLFRSKVSMTEHLGRYREIMVDPIAFEECYGPGEGTDATFPFGAWLEIREVGFKGLTLWGRRHGTVTLPLEPLAVASAVWLRGGGPPKASLT
ncbi:hypothetical protein [Methylobacterium sp. Leaf466]|uniref:hypothetical protein n=1 Tax=Methylobacterium sp. Leaf466 TaxID=1736386 RepID=UPI000B131E97|nr:hypothetical protein [Methylobacterium sp. Leaf466]